MNNPLYIWLMDDKDGSSAVKLIDVIDVDYNSYKDILSAYSKIAGGMCLHTRNKKWTLVRMKELKNSTP